MERGKFKALTAIDVESNDFKGYSFFKTSSESNSGIFE
jgi:hypothetical protein